MKPTFLFVTVFGALILSACSSSNKDTKPITATTSTIAQGTAAATASVNATHTAAAAATAALNGKVGKASNGTLQLANPIWTGSYQGDSGYDAGMNGLKTGAISNRVFSGKKAYESSSSVIYLQDPDAAGFKYQTFGQVFDRSGSKGYASTGIVYTPTDTATINATYKGGAMGTFGNSEVISDMTANLSWTAGTKTLAVTTSNSKIATDNMVQGYNGLTNDNRFNFTENMTWNGSQFTNSNGSQGFLYGATDAAEVGGTLNRTIDGRSYQAGFGGVKQ